MVPIKWFCELFIIWMNTVGHGLQLASYPIYFNEAYLPFWITSLQNTCSFCIVHAICIIERQWIFSILQATQYTTIGLHVPFGGDVYLLLMITGCLWVPWIIPKVPLILVDNSLSHHSYINKVSRNVQLQTQRQRKETWKRAKLPLNMFL